MRSVAIRAYFQVKTVGMVRLFKSYRPDFGHGELWRHSVAVATVAQRLHVSEGSVYRWLKAFLLEGYASLVYQASPGRPAKLTKTQKTRLKLLVTAGLARVVKVQVNSVANALPARSLTPAPPPLIVAV